MVWQIIFTILSGAAALVTLIIFVFPGIKASKDVRICIVIISLLIVGFTVMLYSGIVVIATPTPFPSSTPTTTLTFTPTSTTSSISTQILQIIETPGLFTSMDENDVVDIPTNAEMQAMFGFDELGIKPVFTGWDIPWEPAQWRLQWTSTSDQLFELKLLDDWEFTVTLGNDTVAVYYGDGVSTIPIKGATFRYLPAYNTSESIWANDRQEMLRRENEYSSKCDPSYIVVAGNFSSEDFETLSPSTPTPTFSPSPTPTSTPAPSPTSTPSPTPTLMPAPEIYASTDNGYSYSNEGVYLYDGLAEKVTFTCRAALFPKNPNLMT